MSLPLPTLPLSPTPHALLFDFDGVLVDSERLHCATMSRALLARFPHLPPLTWPDYTSTLMGFDDRDAFSTLLDHHHIPSTPTLLQTLIDAKAALFAAEAAAGHVPALPGAADCVRAFAEANIPLALCSGALRSDIAPILSSLGLTTAFRVLVTAEDVPRSKPDPSTYLLGLDRLRASAKLPLPASQCWAIEDTPDGIASARSAGLNVLALTTQLPPAALLSAGATLTAPDLRALLPLQ